MKAHTLHTVSWFLLLSCVSSRPAYAKKIWFSGYEWEVKSDIGGPGRSTINGKPMTNRWDDSTVKVNEETGYLELSILRDSSDNSKWYCAEALTVAAVDYGIYRVFLNSKLDVANMNRYAVFGFFNYAGDTAEIDIEFSPGLLKNPKTVTGPPITENGMYVIQPTVIDKFEMKFKDVGTTHIFDWQPPATAGQPGTVSFYSLSGHPKAYPPPLASIEHQKHVKTSLQPDTTLTFRAHINLWLAVDVDYLNNPQKKQPPEWIVTQKDLQDLVKTKIVIPRVDLPSSVPVDRTKLRTDVSIQKWKTKFNPSGIPPYTTEDIWVADAKKKPDDYYTIGPPKIMKQHSLTANKPVHIFARFRNDAQKTIAPKTIAKDIEVGVYVADYVAGMNFDPDGDGDPQDAIGKFNIVNNPTGTGTPKVEILLTRM